MEFRLSAPFCQAATTAVTSWALSLGAKVRIEFDDHLVLGHIIGPRFGRVRTVELILWWAGLGGRAKSWREIRASGWFCQTGRCLCSFAAARENEPCDGLTQSLRGWQNDRGRMVPGLGEGGGIDGTDGAKGTHGGDSWFWHPCGWRCALIGLGRATRSSSQVLSRVDMVPGQD